MGFNLEQPVPDTLQRTRLQHTLQLRCLRFLEAGLEDPTSIARNSLKLFLSLNEFRLDLHIQSMSALRMTDQRVIVSKTEKNTEVTHGSSSQGNVNVPQH
jgi:hypothetical protein